MKAFWVAFWGALLALLLGSLVPPSEGLCPGGPRGQTSPSRIAGAHCVTATNDSKPISTSRKRPAASDAQPYPRNTTRRMHSRIERRLAR